MKRKEVKIYIKSVVRGGKLYYAWISSAIRDGKRIKSSSLVEHKKLIKMGARGAVLKGIVEAIKFHEKLSFNKMIIYVDYKSIVNWSKTWGSSNDVVAEYQIWLNQRRMSGIWVDVIINPKTVK